MGKQPDRSNASDLASPVPEVRRGRQPGRRATTTGYHEILTRLRAEGFRVRLTCLAAPVQLEGHLPSGERFYLRCRHDTCSLRIAPRGVDPVRDPTWSQDISGWDEHEASSLSPEETEAVLRELLAAYAAGQS